MTITPKNRGFTLIELLTVIAIIGVLAAILIPTVSKVRDTATRSTCANNLRQIALGTLAYAGDNKGKFPSLRAQPFPHSIGSDQWDTLKPYLGDSGKFPLMYCPGPLIEVRNTSTQYYGDDTNGLYVSYAFFGNLDLSTGTVPTAFKLSQNSVTNLNNTPASFNLWTCLSAKSSSGSYLGHSDPSSSVMIQGQNAVRTDGSVRWVTGNHLMVYYVNTNTTFYGPSPGY